jgi:fructokinase
MTFRLGIDLGGTKIEIAALDGNGRFVKRERVPTPAGDYDATLRVLGGLVADMERALGATGVSVGVGTPGSMSPVSGVMRNANSVCLNGRPFKQDFERILGREVRIENDASCFALSEAVDGAGCAAKVVFGVILGTGVGGGIVIGGHLLAGPNAIGCEWGHNSLPWPRGDESPGRQCYGGHPGCIETFLSGPGMAADHAERTGRALTAEAIVARAQDGDPDCEITLQRYEERLARALASVINIIDPDVIVLGGGLSNIKRWYETVPSLWGPYVFSDVIRTRLVPNVHGDSSGVRGAAWLWKPADGTLP